MQPFERWNLLRKFLHWRAISRTRGRRLRFVEEPTLRWRQWARQQKNLRQNEKRARRAVRTCRINSALELWLAQLAQSKIANAAQVGLWLQAKEPAHISIGKRLDHLLEEYEPILPRSIEPGSREHAANAISKPKQLYIREKAVDLSERNLVGLMALKQVHWLLSKCGNNGERAESIKEIVKKSQPAHMVLSPIDRLKWYFEHSGSGRIGSDFENPSALPPVHVIDLILLADEIELALKKFKKANPNLKTNLLQEHYVSTGLEEGSLGNASLFPPDPDRSSTTDQTGTNGGPTDFFDAQEEQSFVKYLSEIAKAGKEDNLRHRKEPASMVDAVATAAKTNLSVMKVDVDKSLLHARSSQIHLDNYEEFIGKKRKQRIQCLRDIQTHCCKCRGPHIARPPFNHGKDYRREPTHVQHQGHKCLFLEKKRAELRWVDETLGNYATNHERFEREIEKRGAETQNRKENMKEALANSLRLMELASGGS